MRGIQQSFPLTALPAPSAHLPPIDPKGVVYTKRWVVELLLDLAGYTSSVNLVDAVAVEPAAGEGAFLGLMVERLADSCQRLGRPVSDCRDALIAYELNEASAECARALAVSILTDKGVEASTAESLAHAWVRTGDYLIDSMTVDADFVIGNPPYIRLEEIPEETAMLYRDAYPTMRGRADLYVAFFEAALRQLKDGGTCAFICADRWMRNHYGAELRDVITSSFAVDVIVEMHNADAFHNEVDAYPAITVIRRRKQTSTVVARANLEAESISTHTLLTALLKNTEGGKAAMPRGLRAARVDTWFQGRDPWPCQSPEQLALLRRLEERFPPLEASARVGIGVATGNDKVFVTKDADLVEPSRLLKLAMARDLTSGSMIWSGHYLVDPWNCDGLVKLDDYPRLRSYFEKHGDALKRRHTAIKSVHAWYKTIDRVTHALTKKRKLYIADIKNVLDPVLDNGETYPHHNLYFIESDDWNLEVLGGLLISAVGQFFIESYGVRMRGGYLRFQAQYLRRIRAPHPDAVSAGDAKELIKAFRSRDRQLATQTALCIYGIDRREMEIAIGH
jgi:adenine-specific DNA-methyltransferase